MGPGTRRYGYTPRLVPWLLENRNRYDAVIVHGVWNYASFGAWRGLRRGPTPYLIFTHGMLDPWFRETYPIKHLFKYVFWWLFEGKVLRDAATVLFTAEEEQRLARGVFKGYCYSETVVPYGTSDVPLDTPSRRTAWQRRAESLGDRPFLLFLSRIHPKKGCDLLLKAFAAIATRRPELDLVIAGPDQTGWKATLEKQATELGISGRIHWPGMLSGDAKWGAFHACEAFVLPSHQENFGIVVAEAMACGKPVLITNKVNIWREVEACGGGLVANDTAEDIGRMLDHYLTLDCAAKLVMGKRAREGFLSRFDIEMAAAELIAVCEETKLLSSRGAPAKHQNARSVR